MTSRDSTNGAADATDDAFTFSTRAATYITASGDVDHGEHGARISRCALANLFVKICSLVLIEKGHPECGSREDYSFWRPKPTREDKQFRPNPTPCWRQKSSPERSGSIQQLHGRTIAI